MALLDKLRIVSINEEQVSDQEAEALPQSPTPGEPAPSRGKPLRTSRPAPVASKTATAKLTKEVAADLATMIELVAVGWGLTDECCAPVLEAQAKPTADAITAILARNPRLLTKFAQADMAVMVMQWLALGRALLPVGKAIYHNHVAAQDETGLSDGGINDLSPDAFPAFSGIPRDAA
ncbi:MAG: hypothetical protein ACREQ5_01565 [Candidatus Dormibacteria bacterium]